MALAFDLVRQWVPYLCFFLLACVLVLAASADSVFIIKMTREGVLSAAWPLKVRDLI